MTIAETERLPDVIGRRNFISRMGLLALASWAWPLAAGAAERCRVVHPLQPPDPAFHSRCPNCGMARAMWARTWKTFRLAGQAQEACSFHCLADMAVKSGEEPREVRTALFLRPRGMVDARPAWYVVGSTAAGTMTMVSKAAFADRSSAETFARDCGGEVMAYAATLLLARRALKEENAGIDRKRLASGRIVPPVDAKDECLVCRMFPARYPRHRCQVARVDGGPDHFCSTHCLFSWLGDAPRGRQLDDGSGMIWVTDFVSERWISAETATYVVASRHQGPMGAEAIAFDRRDEALEFTRANGGSALRFDQVETGSAAWQHVP